jgi:transposase
MYLHANAKLGLAGRLALVRAIEAGMSLKAAAAAFNVSPATAHRWWHRWRDSGRQRSALLDRSSRPHRSPRLLAAELQQRICDYRRQTGWGPRVVGGAIGVAHSTVWKVLKRAGISRRRSAVEEPANRYEWPCPGDLLDMDVCSYARFLRPGHRVRGDRSQRSRNWMRPETRVGYDHAHAIVDDHSRLAYVELHDDENAATVTAFVERALALLRRARDRRQAGDDGQRLQLRQEPLAAGAARPRPDPPPHDRALPATHQRESRALPPDDVARMGLRAQLPLTPTAQPSPATLARPLQHAKTAQLNRRPPTDQPRSQRPWGGHLASWRSAVGSGGRSGRSASARPPCAWPSPPAAASHRCTRWARRSAWAAPFRRPGGLRSRGSSARGAGRRARHRRGARPARASRRRGIRTHDGVRGWRRSRGRRRPGSSRCRRRPWTRRGA